MCVEIARAVEQHAPGALLLNVSNPLTALCRAVTKETEVKTVGLCNELVGLQFWLSLVFDVGMHEVDPVVAGVNHCPLVSSLRIGDATGSSCVTEILDDGSQLEGQPIWMDPPEQSHWHKLDPTRGWTKEDIVANNRLKLEIFRTFGVLPGASDTHVAEFFPVVRHAGVGLRARVGGAPLRDRGPPKGQGGRRRDGLRSSRRVREVPVWPSGELVAPLLDAIVTKKTMSLPMNLPNIGQVAEVPEGAVVECMGTIENGRIRPRRRRLCGRSGGAPSQDRRVAGAHRRGRDQRRPEARAPGDAGGPGGRVLPVRAGSRR